MRSRMAGEFGHHENDNGKKGVNSAVEAIAFAVQVQPMERR
jgi:hypothetical protein